MDPHRELPELVARLIAAWNAGDGGAFGELFTTQATYLAGRGDIIRGRRAIVALVAQGAAGKVTQVGEPIVELNDGAARVVFEWAESSAIPGRRGGITCHCVRAGDTWAIDRLANVERQDDQDKRAGSRTRG